MIQVSVSGLYTDPRMGTTAVVLLSEVGGDRLLPIWIEMNLAYAIGLELLKDNPKRPLAHDLVASVVRELRARITRVVISDLRDSIYYARVLMDSPVGLIEIDARPSDSIVLALKFKAPIMIEERVFEKRVKDSSKSEEDWAQDLRKRLQRIPPEEFGSFNLES
jgi:bifunctional DNase/RNase